MKLLIVSVIVCVAISGCGFASPGSSGSGATVEPLPESTGRAASACPNGSFEGCFSYGQMSDYLDAVEPMVAKFFQTEYEDVRPPRDVVFVPSREVRRSICGGYSDSSAYEYCPASRTIYIGQDLLWSFYRRQGDAAPVIALAHEWGHHIQTMLGVPFARTNAESVRFENQADCLSGAFAKFADEQKWLEADDLGDIDGLLQAVGSREGRFRDHGTVAERKQAFELGFKSGARGCNTYFPQSPVG
jgi:predicted metalloprotease